MPKRCRSNCFTFLTDGYTFIRLVGMIYAIFNDQSFKDTLTNDIISFEQLGPDYLLRCSEVM